MLKIEVNLIPGEERFPQDIVGLQKQFRFLAVFCILLLIGTLLFSFSLTFILNSQLQDVSRQILSAKKKIDDYRQREGELLILKNRSDLIGKILNARTGSLMILSELKNGLPEGVTFEVVESGVKGELKIQARSADLFSLNELMNRLSDPEVSKNFKTIEVSSISRSGEGTYNFLLEVVGNEKG